MKHAAFIVSAFVAAGLALGGCATTQAWEREDLARRVMDVDGDEDASALRQHVLSVREGTSGALGGGGGGCGCN